MPSVSHQIAGSSGLVLIKWQQFSNRAGGVFPGLRRGPASAYQFGVYFGEIHGAGDGAGQQSGSQLLGAGLADNHGKDGGRVEHDPIHVCLFALGGLAALREQLIHQRCAGFYILPGAAPGALNATLLGRDTQFIVLDAEHKLISGLDAKGFTKGGGNHDTAILIDAGSDFFHGSFLLL
jgi:hypothetical protein